MTFDELVMQEPELRRLEEVAFGYAHEFRAHVPRCRNWLWYGPGPDGTGIRERLLFLAGNVARNPALRTHEAWHVASWHPYEILPECRQCACPRDGRVR
jgi:hypothetical protein